MLEKTEAGGGVFFSQARCLLFPEWRKFGEAAELLFVRSRKSSVKVIMVP